MIKVEILGKFFDNHSLSIINRYIAEELDKKEDIELFITPLDSFNPEAKLKTEKVMFLRKLASKEIAEPDVQFRHSYPPIWRWPVSNKTKVIYIQPWEYSKVPFEWQYKWETFADAVIAPSKWSIDRYLEGGLEPSRAFIIPNGYNPEIFNMEKEESKFFNNDVYTFVYVGNGQRRKGIDIMIDAWKEAFVKADKVQLFIKDTPQIYGESNILSEVFRIQYKTTCGKIIYNDESLSESDMANIYKNAYAVVHPYRGEGFGMHVQESLVCGALPIISTGGPTDEFVPNDVGYKISTAVTTQDLTAPEYFVMKPGDSLNMMGSHGWILQPNKEDLINKLRLAYVHHNKGTLLESVNNYTNPNTWANVGNKYYEVVKVIHNREHVSRNR